MDWRDKLADWISNGAVSALNRQNAEFCFHIQRAAKKHVALMQIMQVTAIKNNTIAETVVRRIAKDALNA